MFKTLKKRVSYVMSLMIVVCIMSACSSLHNKYTEENISEPTKTIAVYKNVSNIQDDTPTINIEMKDNISLPQGIENINGFIDKENLLISLKQDEKSSLRINLLNIKSNTLKEISSEAGKQVFLDMSGDGKKILYRIKNDYYIYDIDNNSNYKLKNDNKYNSNEYFADYNGRYVIYINSDIKIQDTETDDVKTVELNGPWGITNNFKCNKDDNNVYFSGSNNDITGIFSIDINKMDEVNVCFSLPSVNKDYSIRQFDFINNGQAILFSGHYNKEEGIFLYDISNDSVVKVVSGDFYNLSNDKTKILYDTITDGISNIYGAKINGNTVTSRKCIYNNIDTYAAISISSWWTPNDNTILIDEEDSSRSTEKRHFKLRRFNLKE